MYNLEIDSLLSICCSIKSVAMRITFLVNKRRMEMAYFDMTVKIQAPKSIVWKAVYEQARAGKIWSEKPDSLLVAISRNTGYVYWLKEDADGSTILRHIIDGDSSVQDTLRDRENIPTALDMLSALRTQPSLISVMGLMNLLGWGNWIEGIGEEALKNIKNKAEKTFAKG